MEMRKCLDANITSHALKAMFLVFPHSCHVTGSFLHTVLHGGHFRNLRSRRYCRFLPIKDRRQHPLERYRVHEGSAPRVQNHFTSTSLFSHFKVKWFLFYKITSLHFTLKFWENFSLHFTSIFGKVIIFHFTSLHFIFLKCKITSLHFTLLKKKIHFTSL